MINRRPRAAFSYFAAYLLCASVLGSESIRDCDRALRKLHESFQAYRRAHSGTYPERIVDLVSGGFATFDNLFCPSVRKERVHADARHHLATSRREGGDPEGIYEYELSPVPKWEGEQPWLPPNPPHYTRRDLKFALLRRPHADQIPIIRCNSHRADAPPEFAAVPIRMRNLTTTGAIYWSGENWEERWFHDVPYCARESIVLFGLKGPPFYVDLKPRLPAALDLRPWSAAFGDVAWWWTVPLFDVPPNSHAAPDLRPLFEEKHGRTARIDGEDWWLNGLVQLQGRITHNGNVFHEPVRPAFVWDRTGLPVNRKFQRASWLQGTIWTAPTNQPVGFLVWTYQSGVQERVPIRYGIETARFWTDAAQSEHESHLPKPAWHHRQTREEVGRDRSVRLYRQQWSNPRPNETVSSLDFFSHRDSPASPFIVAINTHQ